MMTALHACISSTFTNSVYQVVLLYYYYCYLLLLRLRERRPVSQKDHPRSQRVARVPSQAVLPKAAVMEMTTCFRCETFELLFLSKGAPLPPPHVHTPAPQRPGWADV